MKVVLQDMTIEGNPNELIQFLSLKDNMKVNTNPSNIKQSDGSIVGTCDTNRH